MVTRITVSLALLLLVILAMPHITWAQPGGTGGMYRGMPYGNYCPGPGWGPYGARNPVRTAEEARALIEKYFAGSEEKVKIGKIEPRRMVFEIEILDGQGRLIDNLIMDRRTGRIRSIY
jgi:hypothetical protein